MSDPKPIDYAPPASRGSRVLRRISRDRRRILAAIAVLLVVTNFLIGGVWYQAETFDDYGRFIAHRRYKMGFGHHELINGTRQVPFVHADLVDPVTNPMPVAYGRSRNETHIRIGGSWPWGRQRRIILMPGMYQRPKPLIIYDPIFSAVQQKCVHLTRSERSTLIRKMLTDAAPLQGSVVPGANLELDAIIDREIKQLPTTSSSK